MNLIDELRKERAVLQIRIDAIDVLLNAYDTSMKTSPVQSEENSFPRSGRTDKQIIWLFENYFKRAVRMAEINTAYNKYNGTVDDKVDNVARRLKKEDTLAMVKYNGMNKLTFYGLPTWLEKDNFKEEYRPDENELPVGEITSEVVKN